LTSDLDTQTPQARDETRLPCEFGANPFSGSRDTSYTKTYSHRQRQKQNLTQFTACSKNSGVKQSYLNGSCVRIPSIQQCNGCIKRDTCSVMRCSTILLYYKGDIHKPATNGSHSSDVLSTMRLAIWLNSNGVARNNEVTQRRARLVLRRVTVSPVYRLYI